MSDLIDRQAAIDSICRMVCDNPEVCKAPCDEVKTLINMPSAQPEIIRCRDCSHFHEYEWYCDAWNNSPGFPKVTEDGFCNLAERREDG